MQGTLKVLTCTISIGIYLHMTTPNQKRDNIAKEEDMDITTLTKLEEEEEAAGDTMQVEKKILVTGATGQFGKAVIESLLSKGVNANEISALVRDEEKGADLKEKGVNVVVGNYTDYGSLVSAFKDVDKLLFVSGNDLAKRTKQHENVVKAAREAGVNHIIYTGLGRDNKIIETGVPFILNDHVKTEKWIEQSGLPYTFLRNTLYMDMIPFYVGDKVLETNSIYFPAGNGKAAVATRSDMAEAAANVLITDGHVGKVYDIVNVEAYSFQDVADVISEITSKNISYHSPSTEEYKKTLAKAGVAGEFVGLLAGFALAQAQGEFDIAGNDLENLLGRKPTTLREYLGKVYGSK